jgi:hypothetical protein
LLLAVVVLVGDERGDGQAGGEVAGVGGCHAPVVEASAGDGVGGFDGDGGVFVVDGLVDDGDDPEAGACVVVAGGVEGE